MMPFLLWCVLCRCGTIADEEADHCHQLANWLLRSAIFIQHVINMHSMRHQQLQEQRGTATRHPKGGRPFCRCYFFFSLVPSPDWHRRSIVHKIRLNWSSLWSFYVNVSLYDRSELLVSIGAATD